MRRTGPCPVNSSRPPTSTLGLAPPGCFSAVFPAISTAACVCVLIARPRPRPRRPAGPSRTTEFEIVHRADVAGAVPLGRHVPEIGGRNSPGCSGWTASTTRIGVSSSRRSRPRTPSSGSATVRWRPSSASRPPIRNRENAPRALPVPSTIGCTSRIPRWFWVTADIRQKTPSKWDELHFLELHSKDRELPKWIGGEPQAAGRTRRPGRVPGIRRLGGVHGRGEFDRLREGRKRPPLRRRGFRPLPHPASPLELDSPGIRRRAHRSAWMWDRFLGRPGRRAPRSRRFGAARPSRRRQHREPGRPDRRPRKVGRTGRPAPRDVGRPSAISGPNRRGNGRDRR